jgi:hypothetical protein
VQQDDGLAAGLAADVVVQAMSVDVDGIAFNAGQLEMDAFYAVKHPSGALVNLLSADEERYGDGSRRPETARA